MKKNLVLVIAFLVLSACDFNSTYEIQLLKDTIEYNEKSVDICQYIKSIDDVEVRDFNREKGKIQEGDYSVICPSVTVTELGKQEIIINVNSIDVNVNFKIEDTTAPEIIVEKNYFQVEKGNEYFDIKKLISVKDNYDSKPMIGFSGHYDLNAVGTYQVEVSAKDKNGNESQLTVRITVNEKEIEIVEKEVPVQQGNGNTGSSSTNNGTNNNNSGESQSQSVITNTLPEKEFLFSSGYYDLQSGFTACQQYRGNASGSCKPLLDQNSEPYGYVYKP